MNGQREKSMKHSIIRVVVVALIFGLVAGGVFVGISYAGVNLLGIAGQTESSDKKTEESVDKDSKVGKATELEGTAVASGSVQATDVSDIVENVMPSIVAITNLSEVQYRDFFGQVYNYDAESAGSGIIVSQDSEYLYIVTNNHVVEDATTLTVGFYDNQTAEAEVKGTDSSNDLAVVAVKITDIAKDTMNVIKVATMGDSKAVAVGEGVIAIGNALGYGQSVTTGVISALDRELGFEDEYGTMVVNGLIQTDAAINPGNSGGALLNLQGEVIGINSAKYTDTAVEGMGYSIPMAKADPIINSLINDQVVAEEEMGYLGIAGTDITEDVANTYNMPTGVYVTQVVEGSAAENAGISKGDIITGFDDRSIVSMENMQEVLRYYKAGDKVEITLQVPDGRSYTEKKVTVKLGKKEQEQESGFLFRD